MKKYMKWGLAVTPVALLWTAAPAAAQEGPSPGECLVQAGDVTGCQPAAFDVHAMNIPTRRINAKGDLDPTAPPEEVMLGARLLEEQLGLMRNIDHLHWLPAMVESVLDPATGQYGGGDMDGDGDGRALTIAGKCLFAGHANGGDANNERPMEIFRIQDDPVANPPVHVGSIPVPVTGADDSIMSADLYTKANGEETIVVARDISTNDGGLNVYEVDPDDCAVIKTSEYFTYGGDLHEMGMWIDPNNPMRHLMVTAAWSGAGRPDPYREGEVAPDIRILAITDETTGEVLDLPITLAHFTLQDVGGPLRGEQPDATGLFADGRFPDYTTVIAANGQPVGGQANQGNYAHQVTFSQDGERVYVAHGLAGFYVTNTEAIAHNTDAALAAGTAGCNWETTNVWVDEVIGGDVDLTKAAEVVNDCIHMVLFDDPGFQEVIAAGDVLTYFRMLDRTRFDPYPPIYNSTGMHSAIPVPGRENLDPDLAGKPRYVLVTSERPSCPGSWMYLMSVESEAFPSPTGTFGLAANEIDTCVAEIRTERNGEPRRNLAQMNHNPTVFSNLVFVSWYQHGVRVIDISNPFNLREVGHAVPAPAGIARSYPVFSDGLFYWMDNDTGIHIGRYTGPRADEIPQTGVFSGNDVPHD